MMLSKVRNATAFKYLLCQIFGRSAGYFPCTNRKILFGDIRTGHVFNMDVNITSTLDRLFSENLT